MVPFRKASEDYEHRQEEFIELLYDQLEAAYRTLTGIGSVKMVAVDLDDTLWRGVPAELDYFDGGLISEGWPLGIVEALAVLKRRGIMLCLLSKNTEDNVRRIWNEVYEKKFSLEHFTFIRANWNPKGQNLLECINQANILPTSVVFLDDNPVERSAVARALPGVRVIEASHYYWKRILIHSAETQGTTITEESSNRTQMVKAQVEREAVRATLSHTDFVDGLDLTVQFLIVSGQSDTKFPRALELINKTNQFNTTGRKRSDEELDRHCKEGCVVVTDAKDRFTSYGLISVAIITGSNIDQIVMSCRVIGLGVEIALMSHLTNSLLKENNHATAFAIDTASNLLSRDLFERTGWSRKHDHWQLEKVVPMPSHIKVVERNMGP